MAGQPSTVISIQRGGNQDGLGAGLCDRASEGVLIQYVAKCTQKCVKCHQE